MIPPGPPLEILYLDNHLIAVNKPFGLATQSEGKGEPSLLEWTRAWIKEEFQKPGTVYLGMVHRLDQPVAGVALFARTSKAASRLSAQFRERSTKKLYRAVVEGRIDPPAGRLTAYIRKEKNRKATVFPRPAPDAKEAELVYRTIESLEPGKRPEATPPGACPASVTLGSMGSTRITRNTSREPSESGHSAPGRSPASVVEVEPLTGRFHQIRAQLAFAGHPIVGDVKYGAARPLPERHIALYSFRLVFRHPVTGEETAVEAPEPPGWPFV
ncbi:MAG: RluA family pseudouridine synthase [Nitrospinae bacterium]|nr:RluA family pseudouridine synthase [Nitrospinota bacterium]